MPLFDHFQVSQERYNVYHPIRSIDYLYHVPGRMYDNMIEFGVEIRLLIEMVQMFDCIHTIGLNT